MKTLKEHDVVKFKYKDSILEGVIVHAYLYVVSPIYEVEVENVTYTVAEVNILRPEPLGPMGKALSFIIPFIVCSALVYVWIAMAVTWWANH